MKIAIFMLLFLGSSVHACLGPLKVLAGSREGEDSQYTRFTSEKGMTRDQVLGKILYQVEKEDGSTEEVNLTVRRLDQFNESYRFVFSQLAEFSRHPTAIARAKEKAIQRLRVEGEMRARSEARNQPGNTLDELRVKYASDFYTRIVAREETKHGVEMGIWLIKIKGEEKLLHTSYVTDYHAKGIEIAQPLLKFIDETTLKYEEIESIHFIHSHPSPKELAFLPSAKDIEAGQVMADVFGQLGSSAKVEITSFGHFDDPYIATYETQAKPR